MTASSDPGNEGGAIGVASDWDEPEAPRAAAPRTRSEAAIGVEVLPEGATIAGRYRIHGMLGQGGFGVVYDAEHMQLGRRVALKVLRRDLVKNEKLAKRFQQEARAAVEIGHPNIVEVFDLGVEAEGAFIAMEKLEGEELAQRIARGHPLTEQFVASVGAKLAEAIAAAHERGIIHRDLKPQNVFLARRGAEVDVVKVIDFGIAKLLNRVEAEATKTGQLFGTPRYMPPEQLRGAKDLDGRVDVYAIGAILYEALTAKAPFDAETYPELVLKIVNDTPPPLASLRPETSRAMIAIVERAMAKEVADRYPSARELADALAAIARGDDLPPAPARVEGRPHSRAWVFALALFGAVAIAGAAWIAIDRSSQPAPAPRPAPEVRPAPVVPAPDRAPAPASTRVHFETTPPGARIRIGGALACNSPCDADIERMPVVITAELDGYETAEHYLASPAAEVRLALARHEEPPPIHPAQHPTKVHPIEPPADPEPPPLLPR